MLLVQLAVLVVYGSGCSNAIVFSTATITAIDISAAEAGQQHVVVGYKRTEGVVMPVRENKDGAVRDEAFSTLSAMHYETGGFFTPNRDGTRIRSVFATGEAAKQQNAPKSVMKAFNAFAGDLFSDEAKFLSDEIAGTLTGLRGDRQKKGVDAVWKALAGTSRPDKRLYTIKQIQREQNAAVLQAALGDAKVAAGIQDGATLSKEEKADPSAALIKLVNANASNPARLNPILDAIGGNLEGIDQISSASDLMLVEQLVGIAAKDDDIEALRRAFSELNAETRT
jgi:hypothetical protein